MSYDGDTQAMIAIRSRLPNAERPSFDRAIQQRAEAYRAGARWAPRHLAALLRRLDPGLRCRWDFWRRRPVIERWAEATGSFAQVCEWPEEEGRAVSVPRLMELLREGDMHRWASPEAYLAARRARSARRRAAIDREESERVMAAVDGLSRRQVRQFIDASAAIAHGEKIVAHAGDEKSLERMRAAQRERGRVAEGAARN